MMELGFWMNEKMSWLTEGERLDCVSCPEREAGMTGKSNGHNSVL
jgi:hypothetical protein